MSPSVSRARNQQAGQWVVAAVVAAFVGSMGLMTYAKYIEDTYGWAPADPAWAAREALPASHEAEAPPADETARVAPVSLRQAPASEGTSAKACTDAAPCDSGPAVRIDPLI